jgi:exodeoxyribonuclease VII large subunit
MNPDDNQPRIILSVGQLNRQSRQLLENHFQSIWVTGEISNLALPASGHWYFTLKDENAQIRCAVFRNMNFRLRFKPENGDQVLLRGKISLYENRGDYQLIGQHMEPVGDGALQRAFEQLKNKLAKEGLFEQSRKQDIPARPRHIAVITSAQGAAIHDILSVLRRRHANTLITIIPSQVQGDQAAGQLCAGITLANQQANKLTPKIDTLLISRGGGSLEDLWPFNEESVARAIATSKLPVVSAVGHETDFTIADLVADLRAPTPSAAAELLSPDSRELFLRLERAGQSLTKATHKHLQLLGQQTEWLRKRLRHPGNRLQEQAQRLDDIEQRLQRASQRVIQEASTALTVQGTRLNTLTPGHQITQYQLHNSGLKQRLYQSIAYRMKSARESMQNQAQLLNSISPLNTLQRGYAIVSDEQGEIVRSSSQVGPGEQITARLAAGQLECRVEKAID